MPKAAIGGGYHSSCGDIIISHLVDAVNVKKGSDEADHIGHGVEGTCGNAGIYNPSHVHYLNGLSVYTECQHGWRMNGKRKIIRIFVPN